MTTFDSHANLAYSAVVTAPSPATTGTSLTVTTGQGARFPASGPFNCTVWPGGGATASPANAEIVRVTAVATDTLTIVRGQEGTTAVAIATGYQIALTGTAKELTDIEAAVNATLGGSLSGTLPNPTIAAGAVGTTQLAAGAVTQLKHAYGVSSSPTTTSGTLVTLPDMSVTLTTTGGDLTASLVCSVSNTTAAAICYLNLALDGVSTTVQPLLSEPAANFGVVMTTIAHWSGVAAGVHTVTGQWATSTGTATALNTARALIVEEAKR